MPCRTQPTNDVVQEIVIRRGRVEERAIERVAQNLIDLKSYTAFDLVPLEEDGGDVGERGTEGRGEDDLHDGP